jgi:two-component system nitrate/nitrite response regulator NarL
MNEPQVSIAFVDDPALVLPGINELFELVDAILRGEMFASKPVASQAPGRSDSLPQSAAADDVSRLTAQEKQILEFLRQAHTNRDIAVSMAISEATLRRYMTNLLTTLRSPDGAEASI